MSKVFADHSISLDGFSAGPNVSVGNGMGDGGERLHEWMFPPEAGGQHPAEVLTETFGSSGAVVVGRRMYDVGVALWGENPPFHMPVFVVTHRPQASIEKQGGTTYHFASGIESALERARLAAGGRDVVVLGGAETIRQCVQAGLLQELRLHLIPVLLGGGTRLFENVSAKQVELECVRALSAPGVTHLAFRIAG